MNYSLHEFERLRTLMHNKTTDGVRDHQDIQDQRFNCYSEYTAEQRAEAEQVGLKKGLQIGEAIGAEKVKRNLVRILLKKRKIR